MDPSEGPSPALMDKHESRAEDSAGRGLVAVANAIIPVKEEEAEEDEVTRLKRAINWENPEIRKLTEEIEEERKETLKLQREAEEIQREREEIRRETEHYERKAEEYRRKAEHYERKAEQYLREAEQHRREREEIERETEEIQRQSKKLEKENADLKNEAEKWGKELHDTQEEATRLRREAEMRNSTKPKRVGDILEKNPPILKDLAIYTQKGYTAQNATTKPETSSKKKPRTTSGAGLTRVHPPQYATLLRIKAESPGKPQSQFDLYGKKHWKAGPVREWTLYQHKKTGLLISAPGDTWPAPGEYESCLNIWETEVFRRHLEAAESSMLKVGSESYPVFSKVMNVYLNDTLERFACGMYRLTPITSERATELALSKTVFFLLEEVFNNALEIEGLSFVIGTGEEGSDPKLSNIRIVDRTYDIMYKGEAIIRIVQENKTACTFPCLWDDLVDEPDKDRVLSNLIHFYASQTGRKHCADRNVLMQLRLYLGIHHRRFGIVCSLNCWTFVELDDRTGTMRVSNRFMANENDPALGMGMLECLIRFICVAMGHDESTFEKRPPFIQEWVKSFFGQDADIDYSALAKGNQGDEEDGDNNGKGVSSGTSGSSSSSNEGTAVGATSSSSSADTGSSGAVGGRQQKSSQVPGPRCWADLEDPRRNAPDNDLTYEQHMSALGTLEGDAVPIGAGRTGWVLRKQFDGVDMAIKLLCPARNHDDDEADLKTLTVELENEERIYQKLTSLQGDVVPRCFGWRWFGALNIQAFVTEYIGPTIDENEDGIVPHNQAESALRALKKIHEAGVLHGDVKNLGNVLWDESRECAVFIDFAFGRSRDEFDNGGHAWLDAIQREEEGLRHALGLEQAASVAPPEAPAEVPSESKKEQKRKGVVSEGRRKGKRKLRSDSQSSSKPKVTAKKRRH